jgi:hypothetical protein
MTSVPSATLRAVAMQGLSVERSDRVRRDYPLSFDRSRSGAPASRLIFGPGFALDRQLGYVFLATGLTQDQEEHALGWALCSFKAMLN